MKREINLNPWNHLMTTSTRIDRFAAANKINMCLFEGTADNYFTILIEKDGNYFFLLEDEQKIFDISQMPIYIKEDWINYNKKPLSLSLINEQIKRLSNNFNQFEEELSLLKSLRRNLIINIII